VNKEYSIILGNCKDALGKFSENSIGSCITDPPYGMGMEHWDKKVPDVSIWNEVYRTLKPGGFCISFCSPQLYHRLACAIEDAGFAIKDQVMWMTTTKMAKKNHLKPAHEPIVVAQKPFKGSIRENYEKWGVGKIDVENTRVPWDGPPPKGWVKGGHSRRAFGKHYVKNEPNHYETLSLTQDCAPDDIAKSFRELIKKYRGDRKILRTRGYWKSYRLLKNTQAKKEYDLRKTTGTQKEFGKEDANPAGRYPMNIIGEVLPQHQKYFYAPRVTRKERGEYNDHPTPKPIALMEYLIKIYCPENEIVLDPFCGSGSTGIAALKIKRKFVGIEMEEKYVNISTRRIQDSIK
jgi:DNA modification methylase